ncbi:cholesterol 7-desaturase nvd-like isoform X2 [Dermacentor albipictus]|uniref:cholesterol 7-desaturase nvd-like isoform X2 n=1 Tax=Dermacentor albipictus TaxID=60249 RepID=UPI0038FCCE4A
MEYAKLIPTRRRYPQEDLPPVYPNGWFPIIESQELKVKQVKRVDVLGLELVAFRTEDGIAHVLDAYCPHLGAHLGVMGRVVGDCIECPFHGWRFDSNDGACTHVPYSAKVPDFVKIKTWTTAELLGNVFLWYHADGEEPSWQVEDVPEVTSGRWKAWRRYEETLSCHIRDLPENESDFMHFRYLHGPNVLLPPEEFAKNAGDTGWGRFFTHLWTAKWYTKEHRFCVDIASKIRVLGRCPRFFDNVGILTQQGPGLMVVRGECGFGNQLIVIAVTPIGPFRMRVVHTMHFEPRASLLFRWLAGIIYTKAFERDLLVWNHKKMLLKPPLLKEDRTIAEFRRWYNQFYSQSSPTWQDIRSRTLECGDEPGYPPFGERRPGIGNREGSLADDKHGSSYAPCIQRRYR